MKQTTKYFIADWINLSDSRHCVVKCALTRTVKERGLSAAEDNVLVPLASFAQQCNLLNNGVDLESYGIT